MGAKWGGLGRRGAKTEIWNVHVEPKNELIERIYSLKRSHCFLHMQFFTPASMSLEGIGVSRGGALLQLLFIGSVLYLPAAAAGCVRACGGVRRGDGPRGG